MVLSEKAEGKGEINNARGSLDSLSKLMRWDENKEIDYNSKFSVNSLIEKIEI